MTHIEGGVLPAEDLLFDWQLDVARLERETADAISSRRDDPLLRAEAECSIDLIEAEIVALKGNKRPGSARSIAMLEAWRSRLQRVLHRLARVGLDA